MDQTQLQQQIALYYSKLSPEMQASFSSMQWMESLREISRIYKLTENQIVTLGTETTLVLLGIISTEEYEATLKDEIKIDDAGMKSMLAEIESKILGVNRSRLREAFEKNVDELGQEKYGGVQKLDERFLKLPQEVQQAIRESNYQPVLYKIAEKHTLSINHMAALEEATTKVMLGMIHPDKYEQELQSTIGIPKEEIREIVSEVDEGVLKNIKEILKSHWGKQEIATTADDVPIPPYKTSSLETFSKESDAKIYEASGVEIVKDSKPILSKPEEKSVTESESGVLNSSGINIVRDIPIAPSEHILANKETEKKLLEGLEHPADVATSIIGDKLSGATKSKDTVTDYSLPKLGKDVAVPLPTKPHDPYHEPIE